jgi:hypothetical protein
LAAAQAGIDDTVHAGFLDWGVWGESRQIISATARWL